MKSRRRISGALALTGLLLAAIPSGLADAAESFLKTGQSYQSAIEFSSGFKLPLPDGPWSLIGYQKTKDNNDHDVYSLVLAGPLSTAPFKVMEVQFVDTYTGGYQRDVTGFDLSTECSRTNVAYVVLVSNLREAQECWMVNHETGHNWAASSTPRLKDAADFLKAARIQMPTTMIFTWHHLASRTNQIDVKAWYDPAAEDIRPVREVAWAVSDWQKDRMLADPAKVAYIEKVKAWGADWHKYIKAGFQKTFNAPSVVISATPLKAPEPVAAPARASQPAVSTAPPAPAAPAPAAAAPARPSATFSGLPRAPYPSNAGNWYADEPLSAPAPRQASTSSGIARPPVPSTTGNAFLDDSGRSPAANVDDTPRGIVQPPSGGSTPLK
jgi:hypothetical protein